MRKLRKHYDGHPGLYLTADLESPLADMHFGRAAHSLEDDFTDVVICNHILNMSKTTGRRCANSTVS